MKWENEISMSAGALKALMEEVSDKAAKKALAQLNQETMNVTDYAEHIGKSRNTVYKMIKQKKLKTNKHGQIFLTQF